MQLNTLYEAMFSAAGLRVTNDGFVRLEQNGESLPATKNGRQAVIPIPAQLSSPHINERMVMHLLSENVLEPESEELAFYRSLLVHRFNKAISTLMSDLLDLGASEAKHKSLSSDQAEYLSLIPDVDADSSKNWEKLVRAMPARQVQRSVTHIYLKKAGMLKGKSFKRVATVKFPLYDELAAWAKEDSQRKAEREAGVKVPKKTAKDERQIFDVTIRKMDREPFMNLLQYLIPQVAEPEAYNYGSNSMMAPGVDALMHSFMMLATRINDVVDLFTGAIDGIEALRINAEWVPSFENIDVMWTQVRDIPRLTTTEMPPEQTAAQPAPAATPAPVQQAQPAPVPQPPAQPAPQGGLPWNQPPQQPGQQVMQPGVNGQWVNGQWVPFANAAWQPAQPQHHQQQAAPAPAGGGVSVAAILSANPAAAGAAMQQTGMPPQMMMYPGMMPMYPGMMPPGFVPGMMPAGMPPGMYPQQGYPMYPGMPMQQPGMAQPMGQPNLPQGNLPWQQRRGY